MKNIVNIIKEKLSKHKKNNTFSIIFIIIIIIFTAYSCKKDQVPEVETININSIDMNSAKSGGKILNNGKSDIIAKGVCWSEKSNPSIKDNITVNGSGSESFVSELTNLNPNSTYYVRAYATNDAGTGYGNELKFNTSELVTLAYRNTYFQVYPVDNSTSNTWGLNGLFYNATSDFNGISNSHLISQSTSSSAAKICTNLNAFGYSDWYLPSRNELNFIYENKKLFPPDNFGATYWSSTEFNDLRAYSQNFLVGEISISNKSLLHRVRCIREIKK